MNPIFIVTMLAVAAVFFIAFRGVKPQSCYKNMSVADFNNESNTEAILIDVRTPSEVKNGHIANAININVHDNDFVNQINQLDKSKTYIVYCRSGARSVRACNIMCNNGFNALYNLQGGFMAWSRKNN